ncbi:MAG: GNAT family N-acetyltransferase [Pirellulaceae bacterium]|nr:GNAT family N-acetyltransferase [Pirellulaceae bacterium]
MNTGYDCHVHYRRATVGDIQSVCDFLSPFMEQQQILTRTPEQVAALLQYSQLVYCDNQVVGFVAVEIYSHKLAEIQCLCVSPEFQRRGIGKELVRFCVEVTRDEGILELMAISASDKFLMDCGFDYSLPGQKRALFIQPQEVDENP